jgi:putative endonuclease
MLFQDSFVYILTNKHKTTLYVGVTDNMAERLAKHYEGRGDKTTFTGRYNCFYLVYYEEHLQMLIAIAREKEFKKWRRSKKIALINSFNPEWRFLNDEFCF